MAINQLDDSGAVIGYRPTLEYKKEDNSKSGIKDTTAKTDHSGKVNYSETLNSFANNLPSSSIKNIDFSINNMKTLVDKLAASFTNGNWNQYGEISSLLSAVENNNEEYIANFIKYHKDNITGSIVPELIGTIYNTKQRLEVLKDTLKELYYGQSNLTLEEIEDIDKAYLQKVQSYESSGEIEKINYLALSYDSSLNRSVSIYAFGANKKAIDIANVITKSDDFTTNQSQSSLIEKLFGEVNDEIDYRKMSYDEKQNIEIMQKTLYNYYDRRKDIIDLYELFSKNMESPFIGNKVSEYKRQVSDAITNVNRAFVGNQYYLSEIAKLEQEKHYLMNIYSTFNYNSKN